MSVGQGQSAIVGSGSVSPSTFVSMLATSADPNNDVIAGYAVQQSTLSSAVFGIAQEGSRYPPDDEENSQQAAGYYTGIAGYTGDPIKVYTNGDFCQLAIATTITPGTLLMPNASGLGIPLVTGVGCHPGALSIEGGVSGATIRVQVVLG